MTAPPSDADPSQADADTRAFELVYRAQFQFVWRTLAHHGIAPEQLEDATHEVFIVLYRKWASFSGECAVTTLLYGIARRIAANLRRSDARHDRRKTVAPAPGAYTGPEEAFRRREAVDLVQRFMANARPELAETFRLSRVEGLRAREIAEALNVNVNTVHTRIRTANRNFAEFITQIDAESLGSTHARLRRAHS